MNKYKPQLACDWHEEHVKFPCIVQVKIDGVHALNQDGVFLGRSLKKHDNLYLTEKFSKPEFNGFCGEMILGDNPAADDLCRLTSGAMRRIQGEPNCTWWIFDYITEEVKHLGYKDRMRIFLDKVVELPVELSFAVVMIGSKSVNTMQELLDFEEDALNKGYEGIIIRDPSALYKFGRCGKTHMGAWRVKRFIEEEVLVTEIEEGRTNNNVKTTNELGRSERSTHQENMQPNAQVGSMKGTLIKDVLDPQTRKLLIAKGALVTVSPGKMTEDERKYYFKNPHELIGQVVKFKLFPKGIKDSARFPTFVTIKNKNDC